MQAETAKHGDQLPRVALRPPDRVMRLQRMGAAFQTRLSFMRCLIRRMSRERWQIEQSRTDWDENGYGCAVYTARTPSRTYSLVGFSQYLDPDERTDRVIAEKWDATFTLYDGVPSEADIERLSQCVPLQEAGRCSASELVLSRANKSVRLFDHVCACLAEGRQPDLATLASVGYLMRTTAVYGNGKFGVSDRDRIAGRSEFAAAFQAELLTVYLIRCFTLDLVEHIARRRAPDSFTPLAPELKRFLGIGNATGLGMAPFLVTHPILINNWMEARETALARVRAVRRAEQGAVARFRAVLARARRHVAEWNVPDERQSARIAELEPDLARLADWADGGDAPLARADPWDRVYRWAEAQLSMEGQELAVSLLLEPYPELVDDLESRLRADEIAVLDPAMTVGALRETIARDYAWALAIDFASPDAQRLFWYVSEEKLEPRLGDRYAEPGAQREMPLGIARDVRALYDALADENDDAPLAALALSRPDLRHVIRRVQTVSRFPYGEIRDNLLGADCLPIDILRCKLAYFGASKFDPKSDRWTRITLYQGAPLPDELERPDADDWCFPVAPTCP